MSNIECYTNNLPMNRAERRAQQHIEGLALAAHVQQAHLHVIASTAELGMIRYVQVKRLQSDLEHLCPDAAEGLAAFTNNALLDMMGSIQQFGQRIA